RPMIAVPTEAESRKPVNSQVTPVSVVCRSCWIVGSAGITAELSTAYASPARSSTPRTTFGRASIDSSGPLDMTRTLRVARGWLVAGGQCARAGGARCGCADEDDLLGVPYLTRSASKRSSAAVG